MEREEYRTVYGAIAGVDVPLQIQINGICIVDVLVVICVIQVEGTLGVPISCHTDVLIICVGDVVSNLRLVIISFPLARNTMMTYKKCNTISNVFHHVIETENIS